MQFDTASQSNYKVTWTCPLSPRLWDFDYPKLVTFSPLDCPEVIEVIGVLKKASLAMMRDILRSDAKQPKLLLNELFGV